VWNRPVCDCQRCGACCLSGVDDGGADYVSLRADEARRMKRFGLTVVRVEGKAYLGAR
jgi:hypothetical protein